MKKYESPKIDFKTIKLNEKIANTCWGFSGKSNTLYYDSPGVGYISFQVGGTDCSTFTPINIIYHNIPEDKQTAAREQMYKDVIASGGNSGNPFKGEGTVIIPDDPTGMS